MAHVKNCEVCGINVCDSRFCRECEAVLADVAFDSDLAPMNRVREYVKKKRMAAAERKQQEFIERLNRICPACGRSG